MQVLNQLEREKGRRNQLAAGKLLIILLNIRVFVFLYFNLN